MTKYWWVSQNRTHKTEITDGFMWSPKLTGAGKHIRAYDNMTHIKKEDIVVSFYEKKISAIGIVTSEAYDYETPIKLLDTYRNTTGWRVDVEFTELENGISIKDNIDKLEKYRPRIYSPFQANGNGNESYLFELSEELFNALSKLIYQNNNLFSVPIKTQETKAALSTSYLRLTETRAGAQMFFRNRLIEYKKKCLITDIDNAEFLIASHIKPWAHSDDSERIDVHNGFLLAPHIDKLFDNGYISFENDGTLLISPALDGNVRRAWITKEKVEPFVKEQHKYLKYHRENIYKNNIKK